MDQYTLIFVAVSAWVVIVLWTLHKKRIQKRELLKEQLKPIDVNGLADLLEKTEEVRRTSWADKKRYQIEQAGSDWSLNTYFVMCLIGAVFGFMGATLLFHSSFLAFICAIVGLFYPNMKLGKMRRKNLDEFSNQFRNTLTRMSSNLRAGATAKQAVLDVARNPDAAEIMKTEFRKVYTDMEFGLSIEDAFYRMYDRTKSDDVKTVAVVMAIQRQKGGNLAELLDSIQQTITDRTNQKRRVKTLTAQTVSQANMLSIIPVVMFMLFNLVNPKYYGGFTKGMLGQIIVLVCFGMIGLGNFIMRKMSVPK